MQNRPLQNRCRHQVLRFFACCLTLVLASPQLVAQTAGTGAPTVPAEPQASQQALQQPAQQDAGQAALVPPLDGREGRELLLRNFRPVPQLVVPRTKLDGARFPVVDVHTHMLFRQRHNRQTLEDFVDLMDRHDVAVCVSMDGRLGAGLREHLDFLWAEHRERFVVFAHLDWVGEGDPEQPATWACNRPGWAERTAAALVDAKEAGISGLKVFKRLGLEYRDASGKLIPVDAPLLDPIWRACGELGLPVLIHTADPTAFFQPLGPENERWEELSRHPDWHFYGGDLPSRDELLAARNRMISRHPKTNFIGAHMASSADNLGQLAEWLEALPNLYVDPASRISELGRQPYTAREFLIKYADRVLFGTDGPWPEVRVDHYWRFFQTRDENFPYSEKPFPPQGFWRIHGVDLPDAVLRKIYADNAARIVPGVAQRLEAFQSRSPER
ncbi:amidohydrolase family protein [Planctomycetaceae bacterium SH139]